MGRNARLEILACPSERSRRTHPNSSWRMEDGIGLRNADPSFLVHDIAFNDT